MKPHFFLHIQTEAAVLAPVECGWLRVRNNPDGKGPWVAGSNLLVERKTDGDREGTSAKACRGSHYKFTKGKPKSVYNFPSRKQIWEEFRYDNDLLQHD